MTQNDAVFGLRKFPDLTRILLMDRVLILLIKAKLRSWLRHAQMELGEIQPKPNLENRDLSILSIIGRRAFIRNVNSPIHNCAR
jgi:hypothetical protein